MRRRILLFFESSHARDCRDVRKLKFVMSACGVSASGAKDSGGLGDLTSPFGLVKYWHTKDHQNISLEFDPSHKGT